LDIILNKGKAMKKIVSGIALICALFVVSGTCYAGDLAYTTGFENKKTEDTPEGWTKKVYRGTSAKFVFDADTKHEGQYSYQIKIKPPGGSVLLYPENKVEGIIPGKKYELSLWIKAENLGYSPNFIAPATRLNFWPDRIAPVPTLDLMYEMKGQKGWKNIKLNATAPASAQKLTLDFLLTKGTVWLDDVQIKTID